MINVACFKITWCYIIHYLQHTYSLKKTKIAMVKIPYINVKYSIIHTLNSFITKILILIYNFFIYFILYYFTLLLINV